MRSHSKLIASIICLMIGVPMLLMGLFGTDVNTLHRKFHIGVCIVSLFPLLIGVYLLIKDIKESIKNSKVRKIGEEHDAVITAIINRMFDRKRYLHVQVRYKDENGVNQERVLYDYKIIKKAPVGSTIRIKEHEGRVFFVGLSSMETPYKDELMEKDCEVENPYIKYKDYRFMTVDEYQDLHMDSTVRLTTALVGEENVDDFLSLDSDLSETAKSNLVREHLKDVAEDKLGIPETTLDKVGKGIRKFRDFKGGFRL